MHAVQDRGKASRIDVPPDEIMGRIFAFFDARLTALEGAGIARSRLVLDPGLGFAKLPSHNWTLLAATAELVTSLGRPLLVGASRKSFLGAVGRATGEDPRPAPDRDAATAATSVLLAQAGVWGLRVHDVQATMDALLQRMLADPAERRRWQANALAFAERADIYSNAERAAEIIEAVGR